MDATNTIEFQGITLPAMTFGATEVGRAYVTPQGYPVTVIEVQPDSHAIVQTTKGKTLRTKVAATCYGPLPTDGADKEATDAAGPFTDTRAEADEPVPDAPAPKAKRDMSIDDLRAEYVRVIGRPTTSDHRGYLLWKLAEAAKGRIPVGPVHRQATREAADLQVLPLSMGRPAVAKLDAAWKALGFKSRMQFLRDTMVAYLRDQDGVEAAAAADAIEAQGF